MYDQRYFVNDTVEAALTPHSADVSEDADVSFNFDAQETVTVDAVEWQSAFETDEFLRFDAVVAKPIKQTYFIGDSEYTFKKPAAELEKAAVWIDNAPFTIRHPEDGVVRSVDQIHGFWRDPTYDGDSEELQATLYIPANDDEALEWVEEYSDVSVGFYNGLKKASEDDIDAYQVDMYFDHVAGVKRGRCSGSDGCGIQMDAQMRAAESVSQLDGRASDEEGGSDTPEQVNDDDGPDTEDTTMTNCECDDTQDVEECQCDEEPEVDAETEEVDAETEETPEADAEDEPETDSEEDVESDELVVDDVAEADIDALTDVNDEVASVVEDRDSLDERVEELEAKVEVLTDERDSLQETVDEYRSEEMDELVDEITSLTDAWDEDALYEEDVDTLETRLAAVEDAATSDKTANPTTTDNQPESTRQTARTNLDLSDRA